MRRVKEILIRVRIDRSITSHIMDETGQPRASTGHDPDLGPFADFRFRDDLRVARHDGCGHCQEAKNDLDVVVEGHRPDGCGIWTTVTLWDATTSDHVCNSAGCKP